MDDTQQIGETRKTLENLLEQMKEAERLAEAKQTRSGQFDLVLAGITQTATVGIEQATTEGGQPSYEGCFRGVLDGLKRAGFREIELRTLAQYGQAIEFTLKQTGEERKGR